MAQMTATMNGLMQVLISAQPYKPGQGKLARNGTLIAMGVLILWGVYSWAMLQVDSQMVMQWGVPLVVGAIVAWAGYRMVHYPRFADFLISTEAEMNKVSWPSKQELYASTIVVLVNVVILAVFLFVVDWFWRLALRFIGVLDIGGLLGGGIGM